MPGTESRSIVRDLSSNRREVLAGETPFVISARRLLQLGDLERGVSPIALANGDADLLDEYKAQPWYRFNGRRKRYAIDTIGRSAAEKIRYKKAGVDFLEKFNALADDAPVKLSSGQKDRWDEGSASGEYSSRYYSRFPFRVMNDPVCIDVFVLTARKLGIDEEKLQPKPEAVTFSNEKTARSVTSLLTTAGILRQVVSDDRFLAEIHQRIRP